MKTLFFALALTLTSIPAFACPNLSGAYEKVRGSDQYYGDGFADQPQIYFGAGALEITTSGCESFLTTEGGKTYRMKFAPSKNAYLFENTVAWFRFTLTAKELANGSVAVTYSRVRTFLEDYAPVFAHSLVFQRLN